MTALVPPTNYPPDNQSSAQIAWGNRFHSAADAVIQSVWWVRWAGADASPSYAVIAEAVSGTIVSTTAINADTASAGWKSQAITPVTLTGGVDYYVWILWPSASTTHISGWSSGAPAPGSGFTQVGARFAQPATTTANLPTSSSTYALAAVSVSTDPAGTGGGGTPTTPADVDTVLADWFDPSDAIRPTSQPKLYPDTIIGLHGKIDSDGITWDAKMGPMQTYGTLSNKGISAGVEIVRQAVVALPTPASPGSITTLSGDVAALQSDLDAFEAATTLNFRRLQGAVSVPGTGWALIDTTSFVNSLAWAQAADLYVVNFTVTPDRISPTDVAGVLWYPHLAWWAVLNGDFVQGERQFVDFASAHLIDQGRRMPGLLLHANYGGEGTVEAWQLS